jgi:tight adherence protein B
MIWIFVGLAAFSVLFMFGVRQFATNSAQHKLIVVGTLEGTTTADVPRTVLAKVSRAFNRTRLGRWLEREFVLAGITYPPIAVFFVVLLVTATLPYLLARLLAPAFAVVGVVGGYLLLRGWLRRSRERRRERFVQQIPELARVLSNGANAGLSITTAWVVAEGEMAEPAKTEIQRLNAAVRFGTALEDAMLQMNDRLPAREVRVLMSTLVVSARSGGSLIKALRDISLTLDDRKEVRREVRTVLTQSRATGALVTLMGVGILLALNAIQPGTVERMTQNLIGQIALVVSLGLFLIGHLMVQRMTRIER